MGLPQIGDVVTHRAWGYKAVVVDIPFPDYKPISHIIVEVNGEEKDEWIPALKWEDWGDFDEDDA